jgi:DnaD/phage-associated family protein
VAYKWFRTYNEMVGDQKMRGLTGDQFRAWVFLMALANQSDQRGVVRIDDADGLADVLCLKSEELEPTLQRFERLRMIERTEDEIILVNFLRRQYDNPSDMPDAVAKRKQRAADRAKRAQAARTTVERAENEPRTSRERAENEPRTSRERAENEPERPQIQIQSTDIDEEDNSRAQARGDPGVWTDEEKQWLRDTCQDVYGHEAVQHWHTWKQWNRSMDLDVIVEAIRRTGLNGARNPNYTIAILNDWRDMGVQTMDHLQALDATKRKGGGKHGRQCHETGRANYVEGDYDWDKLAEG